jgi:hypothetical protein
MSPPSHLHQFLFTPLTSGRNHLLELQDHWRRFASEIARAHAPLSNYDCDDLTQACPASSLHSPILEFEIISEDLRGEREKLGLRDDLLRGNWNEEKPRTTCPQCGTG